MTRAPRNDNGWATLRIIAVVEAFPHGGIGRSFEQCRGPAGPDLSQGVLPRMDLGPQ